MKLENNTCPDCGSPIPAGAAGGLCPRCLMAAAAVPTEAGQGKALVPPERAALVAAFPQLELKELIGQGGMGFVYRARQPRLERDVALKVLAQSLAADPRFAERFAREGRLLARLNHPNIVSVFDFGQAGPFFYLLMEYVEGVNLRQAMRAGQVTVREALTIVPSICEALQYAHDEGVLHRDIKPENILIDIKGRVKIADFGIAKLLGEAGRDTGITATGASLGTPHYMAPEQLETPADVDHRADIYSLGVVFYELLTGELPLGRFAPPSAKTPISERVDAIVLRALARERELRQQSAGEVKTELDAAAGGADGGMGAETEGVGSGTAVALGISLYYTGLVGLGSVVAALSKGGPELLLLLPAWGLAVTAFVWRAFGNAKTGLEAARLRQARPWIEGISWVATVMCFPVCGFGLFFLGNLIDEWTTGRGGWNPSAAEAVVVPHALAGLGLLPWAVWRLRRAGAEARGKGGARVGRRAGSSPEPDPRREHAVVRFLGIVGAGALLLGLFNPWGPIAWKAFAAACAVGCLWISFWPAQGRAGLPGSADSTETSPQLRGRAGVYGGLIGVVVLAIGLGLAAVARQRAALEMALAAQNAERAIKSRLTLVGSPPVVVETQPVSGARDVAPGLTEILVRFSKPMMDGSWSWAEAWPGSTPEVVRETDLDASGRTFWLKVRLEPGRTYAYWLNSERFKNFKDTGGTPAVPYLLVFQTRADGEKR